MQNVAWKGLMQVCVASLAYTCGHMQENVLGEFVNYDLV